MRIRDWSSDVCSSDLIYRRAFALAIKVRAEDGVAREIIGNGDAIIVDRRARCGRQAIVEAGLPAGEYPLEWGEARSGGRIFRCERNEGARGRRHVPVFGPAPAAVDQQADVADAGFPAVADEQRDIGVKAVGLFVIDAARETRDREAVEIERTARLDVDLARKAGFDLIGGTGLVDVDLPDEEIGRAHV